MGYGEQFGGGWGVYDEVRFEHERYVFFEHGLARIERRGNREANLKQMLCIQRS